MFLVTSGSLPSARPSVFWGVGVAGAMCTGAACLPHKQGSPELAREGEQSSLKQVNTFRETLGCLKNTREFTALVMLSKCGEGGECFT